MNALLEETYQYAEEPQYQNIENQYQNIETYQDENPVESKKMSRKSDFLLKKVFSKVTNLLDSLFYRGFGLSRSKRDTENMAEKNVCPTRTHFIHPRVAFSVKGTDMGKIIGSLSGFTAK